MFALRGGEEDGSSVGRSSACHTQRHDSYSTLSDKHDNYTSIEAELDGLKDQVRRLRQNQRRRTSVSSEDTVVQGDSDTDNSGFSPNQDTTANQESAAARLQKIHERNGILPRRNTTSHVRSVPVFAPESFPTLGAAPRSMRADECTCDNPCGRHSPGISSSRNDTDAQWGAHSGLRSLTNCLANDAGASPVKSKREWVLFNRERCTEEHASSYAETASACTTTAPESERGYGEPSLEYHSCHSRKRIPSPSRSSMFDGPAGARTEKQAVSPRRRKALPNQWLPENEPVRRADPTSPRRSGRYAETQHTLTRGTTSSASTRPYTTTSQTTVRNSMNSLSFDDFDDASQFTDSNGRITHTSPRVLTKAKSQGNLSPQARTVANRTSNFASPTAASKQRSTASPKSKKASYTTKRSPTTHSQTFAIRGQEQAGHHVRKNNAKLFGQVGGYAESDDFVDRHLLKQQKSYAVRPIARHEGPHAFNPNMSQNRSVENHNHPTIWREVFDNDLPEGLETVNKQLGIVKTPFESYANQTQSIESPLRIARSTKPLFDLAVPTIPVLHPEDTISTDRCDVGRRLSFRSQTEEISVCLSGERARILTPIVRRLSSADSTSQGARSPTLTLNGPKTPVLTPLIKELDDDISSIKEETKMASSTNLDTENEEFTSRRPSLTPQTLSKDVIDGASSVLLETIRKGAADLAKSQDGHGRKDTAGGAVGDTFIDPGQITTSADPYPQQDLATVNVVPIARSASGSLSAHDSAILATGSFQSTNKCLSSSRDNVDTTAKASGISSLRANAPTFVPSVSNEPLDRCAPIVGTADNTKDPKYELQQPPITPVDGQMTPSIFPQTSDIANHYQPWLPFEDWSGLSHEKKLQIKEQRRLRGSSDTSSHGLWGSGEAILPCFSPVRGGKSGQQGDWTNHARYGSPIRFARAPLPSLDEERTRHGKGWGIGSAAPGWWYGWRGGDGLEISFVGHGPDAERSPDAPINFHDYKKGTTAQGGLTPSQQTPRYNRNNSQMTDTPTAPRRMRDWATRMGYPQIPCGNYEITHAVEHVGNDANRHCLDGWCHDCVPGY